MKGAIDVMCGRDEECFPSIATMKNCNGMCTLEDYGHTLLIIRNKHHKN
jgi:hypothetical protein